MKYNYKSLKSIKGWKWSIFKKKNLVNILIRLKVAISEKKLKYNTINLMNEYFCGIDN